jgi:hypothetical protein
MPRWLWIVPVVLIACGVAWRAGYLAAPEADAQSTEAVTLPSGCSNQTLTWPVGTPVSTVAAAVTPADALISIFRLDATARRFLGFAPGAPDFANDYTTITSSLEPVFFCMRAVGTLARPAVVTSTPAPATPAPVASAAPAMTAPTCCRVCTTGKPCGNSCINVNLTCNVGPGCACQGSVDPARGTFRVSTQDGDVDELVLSDAELWLLRDPSAQGACDAPLMIDGMEIAAD